MCGNGLERRKSLQEPLRGRRAWKQASFQQRVASGEGCSEVLWSVVSGRRHAQMGFEVRSDVGARVS